MGGFSSYDDMITKIAILKSDGDKFLIEELRSEMHFALPGVVKIERMDWIKDILSEVADAYLRGFKGR